MLECVGNTWRDSNHTYEWVMSHKWINHATHMKSCVTWLIHLWYDSFIRDVTYSHGTYLIHMARDSFICDMTHSYVAWLIHMRHDSFICDVTHSHVWHDSFMCDVTYSYVWHDSFICYVTHSNVAGHMWFIHMLSQEWFMCYGVASISRLLKIIGLICRI